MGLGQPEQEKEKNVRFRPFGKEMVFSWKGVWFFAFVFAAVGLYLLWRALAGAPLVATVEAEQMNLPSSGTVISDASASAGQAVKLTQTGELSGSVNLTANVSSLGVAAKGSRCSGSWPSMTLYVDGRTILTLSRVTTTSWNEYPATAALSSGSHNVKISYSTESKKLGCLLNLYLDVLKFYGQTPAVAPAPTITLSASPTSVTAGSSSTLTWSSTNTTSCTASGAWSGSKPTSGSASTGALNVTSTYSLACTGDSGATNANVTVEVIATGTIPKYGFALGYRTLTRSSTDRAFELTQVGTVSNGRKVVVRTDSINNSTGQSQLDAWVADVRARGFEPMLTLFGTGGVKSASEVSSFASSQATKWKGKVRLYEFMNEPDLNGWTPEQYTADLIIAYKAIKQVDPSAIVIAGALWIWDSGSTAKPYVSPGVGGPIEWVQRMYTAGARGYFDMLSLHLYNDPDTRAPSWNIWDWAFYTNPSVRSVMNVNGDSSKLIISTESGGSTSKPGESQQTQATKIEHGFNHLASGQIGMYLVYSMMDDEIPGFGLLNPDRTPKMAWYTYQNKATY